MVKTPERIKCITGENHVGERKKDEFFEEIYLLLKQRHNSQLHDFNIIINELSDTINGNPTDNYLHMLLYQGRVVATVLETRTELNNAQYDFFQNLEGLI